MKRSMRRPAKVAAVGLGAFGTALALSGCVLTSPAIVNTPYAAGDGSGSSIVDPRTKATIKLDNFLIVASDKGQPGALVGGVTNTGSEKVNVRLAVAGDDAGQQVIAGANVAATPGSTVKVGSSGVALRIDSMPKAPGGILTLVASTEGGGSVRFNVPVLTASGPYATETPAPLVTAQPATSESATASAEATTSSPSETSTP